MRPKVRMVRVTLRPINIRKNRQQRDATRRNTPTTAQNRRGQQEPEGSAPRRRASSTTPQVPEENNATTEKPQLRTKNSRECRSATPPGNSSADGFRTPVGVRPCAITSSCLRWSSWQPSEQRSWPMQPSGPSAQPSSCSLRPWHPPRRRSSSSNANDASWASPP